MRRGALLLLCAAMAACGGDAKKSAAQQASLGKVTRRAEACFDKGRYDCAMTGYAKALKAQPGDPDLLNRFGVSARLRYYVTGEADYRDQELVALRKAAKGAPKQARVQVNLGTTCWEMGLRREAATAYGRALSLEPKHPDAALMRARIKRSTQEVEEEQEE